ncbi:MAG: tyrosine-type recombinase/integrase [Candidatus Bathyarchaeia archaeon]
METVISLESKPWVIESSEKCSELTDEMKKRIIDFYLSLHGCGEETKENYVERVKLFGIFLTKNGIMSFEGASRRELDLYLSKYSESTRNLLILILKKFYRFIGKPEVTQHLKLYKIKLEQITPSETLSPEEVVAIASEAGKKREMNKILILTLYESCARISEVLNLKLGDVQFSSVVDKEGKRKLIATLYFKRSKGGVKKQPVTLIMFASELKRWVDNHPCKGNEQAYLFPSPYNPNEPVSDVNVLITLRNAGKRLGIRKRLNPHWFRHSALSFFANNKNYNEQLLMWRAGWTNTAMTKRYIHSGAELEAKAYLERMGFVVEEKEEKNILPKTCPHCQALNPFTNTNCDFCGMPLDIEEYKAEIEKRRRITEIYDSLKGLSKGTLTEEQEQMIKSKTETISKLIELGRDDLAKEYIERLLEGWVKTFLTA